MEEEFGVYEWRIENLSHWREEVHGKCIRSPLFYIAVSTKMELYPKGINGQGVQLMVRLCNNVNFSGELSLYSSDGSLLWEQQVNAKWGENLELPPGPEFEDVLSRIRESGKDYVTLRLRIKASDCYERRMCTTIHVIKVDLEISPRCIEDIKSSEYKNVFFIENDNFEGLLLNSGCINNKVHFSLSPTYKNETPFAVEMCLKRSDVDNCVKREHVFCDDRNSWSFPDSLEKEELVRNGISLLLSLKITTSNLIWSHNLNWYYHNGVSVSQVPINTFYPSENGRPSTGPDASSQTDSVVTRDSGTQTCVTSDVPGDSIVVLSKELMCLYQDQDFSDLQLKCGNVSFPVHRAILCARSPVFKTMLSCDMTEAASGQVVVEDLDPSTLSLFLTYLYTGAVEDLQSDRALKLYYAADKYQVPSLKRECGDVLCSKVCISNVCDILSLGDKHNDDELIAVSHDFILDNFNEVLKSKEWDSLKKSESLLAVNTLTQFAAADRVGRKHHPQ